ncbi:MAG: heat-inducible transcription repressor HrcA [Chlorobiaceae bacterium]|nr:heat-inducible transcription repressor HrcA [Chlorobiaceae bacterium]MBA4309945.1 heat-inducible transcription repressor HrcA [Chlorobiaceae bacterium]
MVESLNDREKSILRYVVQHFILTASPVGSRNITKKYDIDLSPATVRNIMSDLEDYGYINHPHTSAGRVPTDKGYRLYVNELMEVEKINSEERRLIDAQIDISAEREEILGLASKILSNVTNQIACVLYPNFDSGLLEKIQLIQLSTTRILVVITIQNGLVKTITLEMSAEVKEERLHFVQSILNERLNGLKLSEIRATLKERLKDLSEANDTIVTLFLNSQDKIFKDIKSEDRLVLAGTKNLIKQPEFDKADKIQNIVELMEDKDIIIHLFEDTMNSSKMNENISITIGSESKIDRLEDYSLISKEYRMGDLVGMLGIIGPKRMDYQKIIAIVDYVSKTLSNYVKI